jgi:hypothetical protein
MLKKPAEYERDNSSVKFKTISRQDSPDSLVGVSAGISKDLLWDNQER